MSWKINMQYQACNFSTERRIKTIWYRSACNVQDIYMYINQTEDGEQPAGCAVWRSLPGHISCTWTVLPSCTVPELILTVKQHAIEVISPSPLLFSFKSLSYSSPFRSTSNSILQSKIIIALAKLIIRMVISALKTLLLGLHAHWKLLCKKTFKAENN